MNSFHLPAFKQCYFCNTPKNILVTTLSILFILGASNKANKSCPGSVIMVKVLTVASEIEIG